MYSIKQVSVDSVKVSSMLAAIHLSLILIYGRTIINHFRKYLVR